MKIGFVVEGGSDSGLGHVYHSMAIADKLNKKIKPVFVTRSKGAPRQKISGRGYDVLTVGDNQTIHDVISTMSPDVVTFDVPWLAQETLTGAHERFGSNTRLVVVGNRNNNLPENVNKCCDVVIDFNIGESSRSSGRFYDNATGTLNLVGLQYLVLRSEFYHHAHMSTTDDDLTQILLMFGASDPSNFTSAALSCLLESYPGYDIDVILGAGFSHHSAFDTVLENHKDQQGCVTVTQDVRDVAPRMLAADVVITSPGLTMMEAIALRRPIIAFYQNELQEIWQCYPFVHCPDRLNHLVTLIEEAHGSFAELTSDHNIDFLEGKNQVIDAISSM